MQPTLITGFVWVYQWHSHPHLCPSEDEGDYIDRHNDHSLNVQVNPATTVCIRQRNPAFNELLTSGYPALKSFGNSGLYHCPAEVESN